MDVEKKILIVSDCVFYPQNEGNSRRIYNIIKLMQSLEYVILKSRIILYTGE